MTAPIQSTEQVKKKNITSLKYMRHILLNAIDENNFAMMENILSQMLDHHICDFSICEFYYYADTKHQINICEYLKHILLTSNNTCNIIEG